MEEFAKELDFKIITRSPSYPQSNGLTEAAVKIAKSILCASSPTRALLLYRTTLKSSGFNPAQLLMNRQLLTTVPSINLQNQVPRRCEIAERQEKCRVQMEQHFSRARWEKPLPKLQPGRKVFVEGLQCKGTVIKQKYEPCSYDIKLDNGTVVCRNRKTMRCSISEDDFFDKYSASG